MSGLSKLRIAVWWDEFGYVANACEVDICAAGPTIGDAVLNLGQTIKAEADESENFVEEIGPAPAVVFAMLETPVNSEGETE